jgi:uncharacterized caspase-like protein
MTRFNLASPGRRSVLKAGAVAGSLFLPSPFAWVWAQSSDGAMKLLRAQKMALVLGNSKYKEAPLKNPANDAQAIGDALKASGFEVTMRLDANREQLAAAVQEYIKVLSAKNAVGLFYYAGHGVQLAWRNYMMPTDMDIDVAADIPKQGVEVNSLLEGLTKASNPMNIIILDACRDNPFGNLKGLDHKGLSQMDAPTSTLLAYATSPGNVASDGEGQNGLYTENLLREMKVKDAKIEEVFKRVRLNVRLRSKGAQIPWESTSLEEDFWFQPPAELKRLSDAEKLRLFDEEAALWEKARASRDPAQIEAYLLRYPSGSFNELAQLELDRALSKLGEKKIAIDNSADNPFTKGSALTNTDYKAGDTYEYRVVDRFSRVEIRRFRRTVVAIVGDEVRFDDGQILDPLGNFVRLPDGRLVKGSQTVPLEYSVGKRWSSRYVTTLTNGTRVPSESLCTIPAKERVVIPAGTFDAFRVENRVFGESPAGPIESRFYAWRVPEQLRVSVISEERRFSQGREVYSFRAELVSFKQG